MPAEITLPVFVRIGSREAHWGDITIPVKDNTIRTQALRQELAEFLRAAADEIEKQPATTEGVTDAAP